MSPATESERLRQIEDREAIRELLFAYGYHLDAQETAAYADLFTEDGVWANHNRTVNGRDAIRQMVEELASGRRPNSGAHLISSPVITFESDDVARTRSTWTYVATDPSGAPRISLVGHYHDTVVRGADGRWLFKSREAIHRLPPLEGAS